MSRNQKPLKAYEYLRNRSDDSVHFSIKDLADHVDWKESTARTYFNKKWRDYLIDNKNGSYKVRAKFKRTTAEQFLAEFTQTETIETSYSRERHTRFVQFEFLLPLTREDKLRRALDDLFFKDTIEMRIQDLGLKTIETLIPRDDGMNDDAYIEKICNTVGSRFGGYSISHVQGRYKAAELMTRKEAAEYFATEQLYLVDETTAAVRFIIPCETGVTSFEDSFQSINQVDIVDESELNKEIDQIRTLFFQFFVEAVVATVQGEEEIWLLETGYKRQLYRWRRTTRMGQKANLNNCDDIQEDNADTDDDD